MLPSNVQYCTVKGRFLRAIGDGSDADREPDAVPIEGLTVTFTADLKPAVARNASATPPVTIFLEPITCTTNADGVLLGPDGSPDVLVVASDDEDLDPHGWTYKVTLQSMETGTLTFSFIAPADAVVDLSSVVPVPPSPGADIEAWTAVVTAATTARDEAVAAAASVQAMIDDGSLGVHVILVPAADWPPAPDTDPRNWYVKVPA